MVIVNINTTGKWSGRRIAQKVKRKKKGIDNKTGKTIWYYRVTLANGKTISVENVTILDEVEKKS